VSLYAPIGRNRPRRRRRLNIPRTHYELLGVAPDATSRQIEAAASQRLSLLARSPQVDPAIRQQIAEVEMARAILLDPTQRAAHDAFAATLPDEDERYAMRHPWRIRFGRILAAVSLIYSLLAMVDLNLSEQRLEIVYRTDYRTIRLGRHGDSYEYFTYFTNHGQLNGYEALPIGDSLLVKRTGLWSNPLEIQRILQTSSASKSAVQYRVVFVDEPYNSTYTLPLLQALRFIESPRL
jgi:curved DNA-binding protein CbpA